MERLGAVPVAVDYKTLGKWQNTPVPEYDIIIDNPEQKKISPFKFDPFINMKLALWQGDLSLLNTESIVNSTNESMNERNTLSEHILARAGSDLKREIRKEIKTCKTGEAKITKGYNLPARYVIHTVGPRYNIKYRTAAESALYNSYRNVLMVVKDYNISSLGLCCIHSAKRGYPGYEGAHIAIRTVRRFMEKYKESIDCIVLVPLGEDTAVYNSLLPLYFPRSESEEDFAAYHLPEDVGNEDGEPVIAERQIKIVAKPTVHDATSYNNSLEELEESVNINDVFGTSVAVGSHPFAQMEGDVDKKRKSNLHGIPQNLEADKYKHEHQKRYDRFLRRAKTEDLSSINRLRCFYQCGFDKFDRAVVLFVGKQFPAEGVNLQKALQYFIVTMDPIVNKPYVVVYLHTLTERNNQPDIDFLKDIYRLVDARYKRNLQAFYMVHTTFWSKVVTWFFTTFSASDIKPKVQHIPGLEYLYSRISPDQLDLPLFVTEYDIRVNGTRYYKPEEDNAIGSL